MTLSGFSWVYACFSVFENRDGSSLEEVVEKQADLIEYLKQHNTLLSKRILALTSQQIRD